MTREQTLTMESVRRRRPLYASDCTGWRSHNTEGGYARCGRRGERNKLSRVRQRRIQAEKWKTAGVELAEQDPARRAQGAKVPLIPLSMVCKLYGSWPADRGVAEEKPSSVSVTKCLATGGSDDEGRHECKTEHKGRTACRHPGGRRRFTELRSFPAPNSCRNWKIRNPVCGAH